MQKPLLPRLPFYTKGVREGRERQKLVKKRKTAMGVINEFVKQKFKKKMSHPTLIPYCTALSLLPPLFHIATTITTPCQHKSQ